MLNVMYLLFLFTHQASSQFFGFFYDFFHILVKIGNFVSTSSLSISFFHSRSSFDDAVIDINSLSTMHIACACMQ